MTTATDIAVVKFHASLNVSDLGRSVGFYRALFGREPSKLRGDYAKFELDEPPVVLSLIPTPPSGTGTLNHAGIRMADSGSLVEAQHRLEAAGIRTQREEGVECCYARQTKFWATDPDGTLWEIYVFHEDIADKGLASIPDHILQQKRALHQPAAHVPALAKSTWLHRLTDAIPARIPHADASVDEVQLEGTFNVHRSPEQAALLWREVGRVLKPGGEVRVHGLTGNKPFVGKPMLPGPAAAVRHIPVTDEAQRQMRDAGLVGIHYAKLGDNPCFMLGGVEMRETLLIGSKPTANPCTTPHDVMYKGPFASITDDTGRAYPRGQRVSVDAQGFDLLRASTTAGQFLFFPQDAKAGSCASPTA